MVFLRSILTCFVIILSLFTCFSTSSLEEQEPYKAFHHKHTYHLSPKMRFEVIIHGFLLWASLGFLMPLGTLIIRISNTEKSQAKRSLYFYLHLIFQMLSVVVGTVGAIWSIKTFQNSFNNNHQRIGLALYGAIWLQSILGFFRPQRGSRKRSIWYFAHWIFGITVSIVGIVNIYTGLVAFKEKTKQSVTLWTFLFTIQISFFAFFYLFQDKWDYMKKQGAVSGEDNGQIRPSDQENPPEMSQDDKDLWKQPCSKSNALKNLFKS